MKKFQLDQSIITDINAVKSDSFKDNISMIEVEKLKPSLDNFYSINEIEILAEDIERQGLKHNLVVTEDADCVGTYFIKSGHRRYTAVKYLIDNKRYTSRFVPCLIDGIKSKNENLLDLIMLNATSRVMTDSELFHQYEVLRDVLKQMELEGKKIKGRMREKIASLLNVSSSQIGKIENIKRNAIQEVKDAVEDGTVSIATANNIAKLPESEQKELAEKNTLSEIKTNDIKPKKSKKAVDDDFEIITDTGNISQNDITSDNDIEDDTEKSELNEYRSQFSLILKYALEEVSNADSVKSILSIISEMQKQIETAKEVL